MNNMFCRQCGAPIPSDSRFCPKCGAQTEQQAQFYYQQTQPYYIVVNKPKVLGRGMGITALVLGIIGVVYSFIMFIASIESSFGISMAPSIMMFLAIDVLAISFGGVALNKGYKKTKTYAGLTLGIIGAVFAFLALIV